MADFVLKFIKTSSFCGEFCTYLVSAAPGPENLPQFKGEILDLRDPGERVPEPQLAEYSVF